MGAKFLLFGIVVFIYRTVSPRSDAQSQRDTSIFSFQSAIHSLIPSTSLHGQDNLQVVDLSFKHVLKKMPWGVLCFVQSVDTHLYLKTLAASVIQETTCTGELPFRISRHDGFKPCFQFLLPLYFVPSGLTPVNDCNNYKGERRCVSCSSVFQLSHVKFIHICTMFASWRVAHPNFHVHGM